RATGLTFAPEAGTQRMRDVVNKNVTEEQLHETAERVFSRGWGKMKLYFMIGLPTETDDDVRGIVETGARTVAAGKRAAKSRAAEVTVSVSTHVPKPHTPFQWCAMDTLAEVSRKQQILRDTVRPFKAVKLRTHEANASVLEGIFARGDRPLADVLERAWKNGARFDSWDEQLKLDVWEEAFTHFGVDRAKYLGTLPLSARLPWSHVDVGLEDGFLAKEYRKALQSRLSPPCGKVAGTFVHHTNLEDARADERRLVCYDCGVACDLTMMRDERITFLDKLGAEKRSLPVLPNRDRQGADPSRDRQGADPSNEPVPIQGPLADARGSDAPAPRPAPPQGRGGHRYRFRYEKTGSMALLGHLDVIRELPRVMRRVGQEMVYTRGFHPKPDMSFGPALSLGVLSLDEYLDIRLARDLDPAELAKLTAAMTAASPAGLVFRDAVKLVHEDLGISRMIDGARYLIVLARAAVQNGASAEEILAARCAAVMSAAEI
ncbi:MAG: TIGR03936 family radical SAM-associated protein, partial [Myxococcales bacterium]